MADRQTHNREGKQLAETYLKRLLTKEEVLIVDEINKRLDQFAHYPDMKFLAKHRKFLHHKQGIEYFGLLYGPMGVVVATAHVLRDTGHLPNAWDYYTSGILAAPKVDVYGAERHDD